MTVEIINLGLPKSGTTTLKHALTQAGFSVADHRMKSREDPNDPADRVFVGDLMYQGLFKYGDPLALLNDHDALTEISFIYGGNSVWPQCDHALLLALRKLHPKLCFIATRRDTEHMAHSIMRWNNLGKLRIPLSTVPGLPVGYGHEIDEQMIWIDGHYEALEALVPRRSALSGDSTLPPMTARQEKISSHLGLSGALVGHRPMSTRKIAAAQDGRAEQDSMR